MDRRLFMQLKQWKEKKRRKPLILMGARQVGKTYLLQQFGKKEYGSVVYLNFEEQPSLIRLFDEGLDPAVILRNLEIHTGTKIQAGQTLVIFDEIQESPAALNSLKYFCEKARDIHLCAAGSLLGVKLMHTKGFPVGKVDFLHLYPLGFLEFLQGIGEEKLYQHLEELEGTNPISEFLHQKLIALFRSYLFVGGMPEAVVEYAESKDLREVRKIHQAILDAYRLDFAKHAPKAQLMKISQVWDAVPGQLAKENKKFIYSFIRKGARAREFEEALQWLAEAGLILKVHHLSVPKLPLEGYANFDFFKVYLLDVGLLGAASHLSAKAVLEGNRLFQEFRGALTENFVAQELARSNEGLYYWTSEGRAEIDFILQQDDEVYPLEVKSGTSSKKKSLRVYDQLHAPKLLVRTSPMNLKLDGRVLNCPLYLLGRVRRLIR